LFDRRRFRASEGYTARLHRRGISLSPRPLGQRPGGGLIEACVTGDSQPTELGGVQVHGPAVSVEHILHDRKAERAIAALIEPDTARQRPAAAPALPPVNSTSMAPAEDPSL
jgi:hypothetical protein